LVGVAEPFVRRQFQVFAMERVAMARRKVAERHFERPADTRLEVVHLAREAIRRQPLAQRVGLEERPIDFLGLGTQDTVQADGAIRHRKFLGAGLWDSPNLRARAADENTRGGAVHLLPANESRARQRYATPCESCGRRRESSPAGI